MVRYEKDHLVIDIDVSDWDAPKECRSQLMKALILFIRDVDRDNLPDNSIELWWLCRLLGELVDEG